MLLSTAATESQSNSSVKEIMKFHSTPKPPFHIPL